MTSTPWNRYVQVPSVKNGNTSDTAYGKLDTGEMPSPAYTVMATAKLLTSTASARASSPRTVILFFVSIVSLPFRNAQYGLTIRQFLGHGKRYLFAKRLALIFCAKRPVCNTMLLFCPV